MLPKDSYVWLDPIEHLAKALSFDHWRDRGFVVATTIYADASGDDHSQPICLVAGWWNSVDNWLGFGCEWRPFLVKHGIKYLHQTKSKNDPDNDRWKNDPIEKDAVLSEAVEIIRHSGAVGFAFYTPTIDYHAYAAEVKAKHDLDKPDCFAWNAFRFVTHVEGWCRDRHLHLPEFVFEASNKEEQNALRDVMSNYKLPDPVFRRKLEEDPARTVLALQAADFLAYEIFRGWREVQASGAITRPYLEAFEHMEHHWGWTDKEKMDSLIPVSETQHILERIVAERDRDPGSTSESR